MHEKVVNGETLLGYRHVVKKKNFSLYYHRLNHTGEFSPQYECNNEISLVRGEKRLAKWVVVKRSFVQRGHRNRTFKISVDLCITFYRIVATLQFHLELRNSTPNVYTAE